MTRFISFWVLTLFPALPAARGSRELPVWIAQEDFDYDAFMTWVTEKKHDIAAVSGTLKADQIPEEFDIDLASQSKTYKGHLRPEVIELAKTIDKWDYTKYAWKTGDMFVLSSPPLHLYIMSKLFDFAGKGKTFVDAGCGSGYLLLFWHKLCFNKTSPEPGSCSAIGLEFDSSLADDARRIARSHPQVPRSDGSKTDIFTQNILRLSSAALSDMQGTDAMYVSPAVWALQDLEDLATVIRVNGVMLINLCIAKIEGETDKCKARFAFYRKTKEGGVDSLEEDTSDGSNLIEHTAVIASKPSSESASAGQVDVKFTDVQLSASVKVEISPHAYKNSQ